MKFTVSALDAEDGVIPAVATPHSDSWFPIGKTEVVVTATDSGGLTTTGHFFITVVDTTGPKIDVKDHYDIHATGPGGALVSSIDAKAKDKVDGACTITYVPSLPHTFALGPTLLTLRAEDSRGNFTAVTTMIYVTYDWDKWVEPSKPDYRRGETIQVAFKLKHPGPTPPVTTAVALLTLTAPDGTTKIAAQPFTYDAGSDQYRFYTGATYGFPTAGWVLGEYTLSVVLGDGVSHTYTFKLKLK